MWDNTQKVPPTMMRIFTVVAIAVLILIPAAASPQVEAPSLVANRYVQTLGPFKIDGREFTVKLHLVCYQQSKHAGGCDEDDEQTVNSVAVVDENGKTRFKKSFTAPLVHQAESHLVEATLLEGHEHQALELAYEDLSSPPPTTDQSIQLFGLQNGILKPLDQEPLEFQGALSDLPAGESKGSKHLLENDTLRIYGLTDYFYISIPVRVNWKDFRLEEQDSGDFDLADQGSYETRPDIESEQSIQMYPLPDKQTRAVGVTVTPGSDVKLLKARFKAAPPDKHDSADDTWLKIRIDGHEGWIIGVDDYRALGLNGLT